MAAERQQKDSRGGAELPQGARRTPGGGQQVSTPGKGERCLQYPFLSPVPGSHSAFLVSPGCARSYLSDGPSGRRNSRIKFSLGVKELLAARRNGLACQGRTAIGSRHKPNKEPLASQTAIPIPETISRAIWAKKNPGGFKPPGIHNLQYSDPTACERCRDRPPAHHKQTARVRTFLPRRISADDRPSRSFPRPC